MVQSLLKIRGLHKHYGSVHALRGVSADFQTGEFVVIIGPSGAGKSTFIRCINRLIDPTEGEIQFQGVPLHSLKPAAMRHQRAKIGMVFQHYNLIGRVNVIKNVLHGKLGQIPVHRSLFSLYTREERVQAYDLLEQVGLQDYLYKRADALSGGQMQRVGICRAMIQDPKLLLADEPIASLDPNSAMRVMDALKSITEQRHLTCIVNLHQVEFAKKYATRIIGLKDGLIVYDGSPEGLDDTTITEIYRGKEHQMYLESQSRVSMIPEVAHG